VKTAKSSLFSVKTDYIQPDTNSEDAVIILQAQADQEFDSKDGLALQLQFFMNIKKQSIK